MRCMACHTEYSAGEICPRCGFVHYQVIGDTDEALAALELMAGRHRAMFLRQYDLGVPVYTWKDQDGTLVQDTCTRLSFGTADALLQGPVWLDREFARLEGPELTLELSVQKSGEPERRMDVSLPVPQEPQLQRLGIALEEDLTVTLMLKNEENQTRSQPVTFLA